MKFVLFVCMCLCLCVLFYKMANQNSTKKNVSKNVYFAQWHSYKHAYNTYSLIQTHYFVQYLIYYKKQFDILLLCIPLHTVRAMSLFKKACTFLQIVSRSCLQHTEWDDHQNEIRMSQLLLKWVVNQSNAQQSHLPNSNVKWILRIICKHCLTKVLLCLWLAYCTDFSPSSPSSLFLADHFYVY